jgi:negative regulator of flagellin synthesis FlgM
MKINNTPNPEALKAYTNNSVANVQQYRDTAQGAKPAPATADKVDISSTVKLFQDIQRAVLESPDIRTDKVKDVETKIAQGTYNPDYNKIADKLLSPDISSRI